MHYASTSVCCTFHTTTATSQRRFLSKNPKNPGYDAVVPFLRRSDLLFTLVSLWCFTGGEKRGLGMRSCLVSASRHLLNSQFWSLHPGTFSHPSRLCIRAPSQFSIPVSASRHLLTSVSSLHSGTFSILNAGLCIQAPSHISLVSA